MIRVTEIKSVKNPVITAAAELKKNPSESAFLLEGDKFIRDLPKESIVKIFTTDAEKYADVIEKSPESYLVSQAAMDKISDAVSQSHLCAVIRKLNPEQPKRLLLLDGIQDPGNVGTIIRTAYAFGYGVVCGTGCANPFSPKTVRSSVGAVASAYVIRAELCETIRRLKKEGYAVFGSALDEKALVLTKTDDEKVAVVIGSEGSGMSEAVRKLCDRTFYIPIENVESLNAAVAAAIMMYGV